MENVAQRKSLCWDLNVVVPRVGLGSNVRTRLSIMLVTANLVVTMEFASNMVTLFTAFVIMGFGVISVENRSFKNQTMGANQIHARMVSVSSLDQTNFLVIVMKNGLDSTVRT